MPPTCTLEKSRAQALCPSGNDESFDSLGLQPPAVWYTSIQIRTQSGGAVVKRLAAELQAAALVDETVAFDLNAAAAYFEQLGQPSVARSLRERASDLLAEAV